MKVMYTLRLKFHCSYKKPLTAKRLNMESKPAKRKVFFVGFMLCIFLRCMYYVIKVSRKQMESNSPKKPLTANKQIVLVVQ